MIQPAADISYDPEMVLNRAYVQIGELMKQRDQLLAAYEAQSLELTRLRGAQSSVESAAAPESASS